MKIVARRLPVATVLALAALAPLLPRAAFAQAAPGQAPAPATAPGTGPVRPAADAARNDQTLDAKITELMNVSGGLTAEQVGKRAEDTSFDLKARQAEIAAAAAEVDKALVGYFPRLSLTGSYRRLSPIDIPSLGVLTGPVNPNAGTPIPNSNGARLLAPGEPLATFPLSFPVLLNQTVAQAVLTVPLSDYLLRISQSYSAAGHSKRAAELNAEATRLKTNGDAKAAYYSWARARLQRLVTEQALLQAQGHLADVRAQFNAGAASKADVLRVESQLAVTEQLVQRAKNLEVVLEEQLRTTMHDPSGAPYAIAEDLRADIAPLPAQEDLRALYDEAIKNRPEIHALDETVVSLKKQATAANSAAWPRLDASGEVTYANPNQRYFPQQDVFKTTWSVGAQISWSPNDLYGTNATTKGIEARQAQTEAQRAQIADGVRLEIVQAQQGVRDATTAIDTSARGLTAAEESYRVRRALFANGRATSVELTDAETDLTRARLDAINARIDLRIARVRLVHAVGRDAVAKNP